jgi:hypothetical protein
MSGSAKKRREKERQRVRRANREAERRQSADDIFERFYPGGVTAFHKIMAGIERREPTPIRDVEFAAFTDPTRHMYAGG